MQLVCVVIPDKAGRGKAINDKAGMNLICGAFVKTHNYSFSLSIN